MLWGGRWDWFMGDRCGQPVELVGLEIAQRPREDSGSAGCRYGTREAQHYAANLAASIFDVEAERCPASWVVGERELIDGGCGHGCRSFARNRAIGRVASLERDKTSGRERYTRIERSRQRSDRRPPRVERSQQDGDPRDLLHEPVDRGDGQHDRERGTAVDPSRSA